MCSWFVRTRKTSSGASSPVQHLLGPVSSTTTWQLSRSIRAQSPGVRWDERSGSLQAPEVRLLLQPAPGAVRRSLPAPLHRHRQSPPRGPDRGCLQGHGLPRRAIQHLGLPTGAPPAQHRQQRSAGEDEGRVCRAPHCRICRAAP